MSGLLARLALLEANPLSSSNGDLQAAWLYLESEVEGRFDSAAVANYDKTFLEGKKASQVPFLGKLAVMAHIKELLDSPGPATARVAAAVNETEQLRALYPGYANGHALVAALTAMQADALSSGPRHDENREQTLRKTVTDELAKTASLDPLLFKIMQLSSLTLPPDITKDLDENPHGLKAASSLSEFAATNIDPFARSILTSRVLTQLAVSRTMLHAMRVSIGERRVAQSISELPALAEQTFQRGALMVSVAEQLADIEEYVAAETWMELAQQQLASAGAGASEFTRRLNTLSATIGGARISTTIPALL